MSNARRFFSSKGDPLEVKGLLTGPTLFARRIFFSASPRSAVRRLDLCTPEGHQNWLPAYSSAIRLTHALPLLAHILDMNALMEFKEFATEEQWEILGMEHFTVNPSSSKINATKELLSLRERGARVVLLSCSAIYVPQVLQQAERLDMITEWVWILTDAAISKVRCLVLVRGHSSFIVPFLIQGSPNFVE